MLISYYKDDDLIYTNRRRYKTFSKLPYFQEKQRSVLLGDGAYTTVKTSVSNICNYVTIYDDINHKETRWYVTSYTYMNGGQVQLNLQRDVIGEFGLDGTFGKIERGYTESILRNRKELQLNQILKKRTYLKPLNNKYGNYQIDNHNNELWGVMYFTKKSNYDPNTGELIKTPDYININIPAFAPKDTIQIGNSDIFQVNNISQPYPAIIIRARVYASNNTEYLDSTIAISWSPKEVIRENAIGSTEKILSYDSNCVVGVSDNFTNYDWEIKTSISGDDKKAFEQSVASLLLNLSSNFANLIIYNNGSIAYKLPVNILHSTVDDISIYDKKNVKIGNDFYKVTINNDDKRVSYGSFDAIPENYWSLIKYIADFFISQDPIKIKSLTTLQQQDFIAPNPNVSYSVKSLIFSKMSESESGNFLLDTTQQLIDEPYIINIFPLYDVNITGLGENYNIKRSDAFTIFNTIIQYLSGENGYLIDAQVCPYCPNLSKVTNKFVVKNDGVNITYPVFSIDSTSYDHECEINLDPLDDIKKEYIEREYSIIPPDKNGKFTFNFYDYKLSKTNLRIKVKTALKPFNIISSAVIIPEEGSLMNMTYESDLRGCMSTSNGFECSLASNSFETYKRQNSTYQQLFAADVGELQEQHKVEMWNDITGTVVNTVTATAMGAIGGASMADAGLLGKLAGTKMAGAIEGGIVAGGVVGTAMSLQAYQNSKLRDYEEELQQTRFDLNIQAIKNLPNSVNRISSFNEILFRDDSFWFVIETYECSEFEKGIVDEFLNRYGYSIGVFDDISKYVKNGNFIRSTLVASNYPVVLSNIASNELRGGIYYIE